MVSGQSEVVSSLNVVRYGHRMVEYERVDIVVGGRDGSGR